MREAGLESVRASPVEMPLCAEGRWTRDGWANPPVQLPAPLRAAVGRRLVRVAANVRWCL